MAKSLSLSTLLSKFAQSSVAVLLVCNISSNAFASENASGIYDYFYNIEQGGFDDSSEYVSSKKSLRGSSLISRGRDVEARSIGTQAGKYWAQNEIKESLKYGYDKLDNVFDISPYLERYGQYYVMPPVITESKGHKFYKDSSHQSFTIADRAFFIRSEPRFVDVIPTWRDYVKFNAKKPQIYSKSLLPQTSEEKEKWKENFDLGWDDGIKSAILNFDLQLARFTYDSIGIQRYQILKQAGFISELEYSTSTQPVSGDDQMMYIGNKFVSIKVKPTLEHDYRQWRMIPELPVLELLVPSRYLQILEYGTGL